MPEDSKDLFQQTFGPLPVHRAFAPGRVEFIGNHTDYNGGLVMGAAVNEGITVAVGRRKDRLISLISDSGSQVEVYLDSLAPMEGPASWVNYPVGVMRVMRDSGMEIPFGCNIAVASTLPAGAGMSSSAAFEIATAHALAALYDYRTDTAGYARIGRKAENEFVGVPCGILDQGVSAFGKENHLVCIDCATETFSVLEIPDQTQFWIFDSNKKHSLVNSHYADRCRECHAARDILAKRYPSARTLSDLDEAQVRQVEVGLGDVLFRRALHVVTENARVRAVERSLAEGDLAAVGAALYASHESSRVNFENSIPELDSLVAALREQPHVHGARLTGGGFGGAVMALTSSEFGSDEVAAVKAAFKAKHGTEASVIHTRAGDGARLL